MIRRISNQGRLLVGHLNSSPSRVSFTNSQRVSIQSTREILSANSRRNISSSASSSPSACATGSRRQTMAYYEGGKLADGTIFRRPLPEPAIELSSVKGTMLFAEALQAGTAKCFFRLMEQLHTQNEPEYCGLATLVTVLNALNIDPHRRWKGVWRFYSEELLDCCEPLHKVKTSGINFDKLAGLARCNGLVVDAVRAESTSLEEFRKMVLDASQSEDFTLTLAYSRKILGQTGSGHYSPMGAYHASSDHLLILDCARFKYRPHWVPLPLMFEAMKVIDPDTNRSRGFMKMSPVAQYGPPPAAHVLALSLRHASSVAGGNTAEIEVASLDQGKQIHSKLVEVASSSPSSQDFLIGAADVMEEYFDLEFKGHGCSSPARRKTINEQLNRIESWDVTSFLEKEREARRKALVLSLDHAYLAELLHSRPDIKPVIVDRVRLPESCGELAVELSFTRPIVQDVIDSGREKKLLDETSLLAPSPRDPLAAVSLDSGNIQSTVQQQPTLASRSAPIPIQQVQRCC